ncbi:MAG: hypothetical protein JWQ29_1396, partial [Phenylobacterium sp.]|nr:hypothetical protein [Phenylobacterium sp.]
MQSSRGRSVTRVRPSTAAVASPAAQSELFQWSVDCSSDALAVLDTDLRFLVANNAWRKEFKVCEGVVGQSAEPLFDGLPAADLLQACLKQTENLGEVR